MFSKVVVTGLRWLVSHVKLNQARLQICGEICWGPRVKKQLWMTTTHSTIFNKLTARWTLQKERYEQPLWNWVNCVLPLLSLYVAAFKLFGPASWGSIFLIMYSFSPCYELNDNLLVTNQVSSSPLGKEGVHPSTFFVGTPAHSGLASRKIKNIRVQI